MADEIVDCRRKDDHTQTHPIALSALRYFPDWEPIPEQEEQGSEQASPPDAGAESEAATSEAAAPKSAPKSARKSTEASKGRGE